MVMPQSKTRLQSESLIVVCESLVEFALKSPSNGPVQVGFRCLGAVGWHVLPDPGQVSPADPAMPRKRCARNFPSEKP